MLIHVAGPGDYRLRALFLATFLRDFIFSCFRTADSSLASLRRALASCFRNADCLSGRLETLEVLLGDFLRALPDEISIGLHIHCLCCFPNNSRE